MIITKTDNKNMAYIDSYGVEYSDDQKTLIKCPTSLRGSYTVSSKVKTIGENAFNKCIELTCINLQEGLEIIEKWAFSGCNGLTSLVIPRSVNRIEQEAFVWCDSLKKIRIESDNITIVNDAFNGCNNIISLEVTDGVKYESRGAVVDIDMLMRGGESAEHFKKYWFALSNIKGISFLQGTKTINSDMLKLFDGIEVVFIPSSVREIYRTAFENAHSLSKIVVDDDNEFFESQDGVLFDKGGKKLLYVPRKTSGTFVVPNTVTTIDQCT